MKIELSTTREMITNNLSLKILAGVLAVLVWIIVNNVNDPVTTKVFKNVTVTIENESAIEELDKVYEVKEGGVIDVKASGKRSILHRLQSSDIQAVADLSSLSMTNAAYIQLSCPKYEYVELQSDTKMLTIDLDDEKTDQYKVDVTTEGSLPDGYALGEIRMRPNLIKVSGAESQIERVSEVRVTLDVSNMTGDFLKNLKPQAYDANGKLMDSSRLKFSSEKVRVSVSVYETKTVPILVEATGTPAKNYHLISVDYEPQSVTITGTESALEKCDFIHISCPINGANGNIETEFALSEYLPSGVKVVDSVESINVKVTISAQKLQTVHIPISDITIKNLSEEYEAAFVSGTDTIAVEAIWANAGNTSSITASDLGAYIDCKDLKEGLHKLEVKFVVGDSVLIENTSYVKVRLSEKEKEEEATSAPVEETEEPLVTATHEGKSEEIQSEVELQEES